MDESTNVGKAIHALSDICENSNLEDCREKIAFLIDAISDGIQIEREEFIEVNHIFRTHADELKNNAKLLVVAYDEYGMVNETFINALKSLRGAVKEYECSKVDSDDVETHILLYEARRDSDGIVVCSCGTVQDVKEYLCREYNVKDYRDAPCYITVVHDYEKEYGAREKNMQ